MTKKIEQSGTSRKKTELSIREMLVAVAVVGGAIGSGAASAHDGVDYGFVAVEVLLLVGLIRSVVRDIERRLASPRTAAGSTTVKPQGSDAQ